MTSLRGVLASVGVATVGVGLVLVLRPSLAANLGLPEAALTVLGAISLVEGARSIQARRSAEIDQATPPDPEDRLRTPMPGEDFDRSLALGRLRRGRVPRRLREAAVDSIAIRRDVTPDEAESHVDDGSWTDDPVAAAYLGGPDVPDPPWRVRLRVLLFRAERDRLYVERTVAAIAAVWEDE